MFVRVWRNPEAFPVPSVIVGALSAVLVPGAFGLAMLNMADGAFFPFGEPNPCQALAFSMLLPLVVGAGASVWNIHVASARVDPGVRWGAGTLAVLALVVSLFALLLFSVVLYGALSPSSCTFGN